MEPNYVVVKAYQTADQKFWSGRKWVTEYPDAEVYETFSLGRTSWTCAFADGADDCVLVESYGLEDEHVAIRW